MYAQKSAEQGPHRGSSFDSVNSEAKPLNNEVTFSKIDGNQDNRSTSTGRTTIEKRVATIIFSLRNEVGGLVKVLKLFQEKHVNLIHIESRKSKPRDSDFEIFVDCDTDNEQLKELTEQLRKHADIIEISPSETSARPDDDLPGVPWFPKKISDLDLCGKRVLMYGSDLDADHPYIEVILKSISRFLMFVSGDPIPRIDFTAEEVRTWGMVFRELNKLYPSHACKEYLKNLPLLSKHCNYSEDNIPQLDDVSHFLKDSPVQCESLSELWRRSNKPENLLRLQVNPGVIHLKWESKPTIQRTKHQKAREFAKTIQRPFTVRYDPYTQSMDVLKDTNSINGMVKDIRHELDIVEDALNRVNA
ncbi:Tryptophan 5-hydroxylase [Collichthys lucidus]|uniref:Tryptophan 5-hydroxylase n=1 Tax=Collichthys lucidus TaxID=240159 RepID=A0A4U5U7U0_COLLU|nr:Tryptophan 5-hydroxylase [Collichthys lucidus]